MDLMIYQFQLKVSLEVAINYLEYTWKRLQQATELNHEVNMIRTNYCFKVINELTRQLRSAQKSQNCSKLNLDKTHK